ncbi:unnamed protein product [Acanthoscelides obtectus]|uniref:Uncharacterized protein n=1 Tax=Acanthoscelides obtectus TaxID=200917 RepID=A0A9P0PED9_ACAOB|nr:unnamed protein product [Acanthoscelides obtectus]CAK1655799.1 hypothetical protein AOBTE_LOCUS19346 [Acanthoscelides obtectus]
MIQSRAAQYRQDATEPTPSSAAEPPPDIELQIAMQCAEASCMQAETALMQLQKFHKKFGQASQTFKPD